MNLQYLLQLLRKQLLHRNLLSYVLQCLLHKHLSFVRMMLLTHELIDQRKMGLNDQTVQHLLHLHQQT
jgi:hypothetical protein